MDDYEEKMKRSSKVVPIVAGLLCFGALPVQADTTGFLLSQGAGKLVDTLIAIGYGNLTPYETLVSLRANANPSLASVLTDGFFLTLAACPGSSPIFSTHLSSYAGHGLLINANCTVVNTALQGSGFNGLTGTTTLSTSISGLSSASALVSSISSAPIYSADPYSGYA